MKAITVNQPWAELIASGQKRIETRSWNTWYRGPLAIHASKNKSLMKEWFWLFPSHKQPKDFGCIVAVCRIVDCLLISHYDTQANPQRKMYSRMQKNENNVVIEKTIASVRIPPVDPELTYGDYSGGRYAWILTDIQRLSRPVPARGRQRLWEVDDQLILDSNQVIAHWYIDEFWKSKEEVERA